MELVETASKQRHENKKRRTKSTVTRVSCTMLSDTATSCRYPSCGEWATREATTKRKKKKTHIQLGSIALHSFLPDSAVFFRPIKNNFVV